MLFNADKICVNFVAVVLFTSIQVQYGETRKPEPTVYLQQGIIVGLKVYPDNSRTAVDTFLGIPYAEPPTGNRRFAVPRRHRGWNGTFFANNYHASCPVHSDQYTNNENEDCLYLNIWCPEEGRNGSLPVIVYVESEHVTNQYSNRVNIPGQDLAAEGSVVVSLNYRQNIFGFFCLGVKEVRGNFGLLDQYMALIWIKDNISKFGGDPEAVTLIGDSYSRLAILYQIISPRTKGLFKKAIIMSGTRPILFKWKNPIDVSQKLIIKLGCTMPSVIQVLQCMRMKTMEEIFTSFQRLTEGSILDSSVLPISDDFLSEDDRFVPVDLDRALQIGIEMPILIGITNSLPYKKDLPHVFDELVQYAEEIVIPSTIKQYKFNDATKIFVTNILRWKYISSAKTVEVLSERVKKLEWDAFVAAPHDKLLRILSNTTQSAPLYVYFLHHFESLRNVSNCGVNEDVVLLFGPSLLLQVARRRFNIDENRLSRMFKWTCNSFVKYGVPGDKWLRYENMTKYMRYFGTGNNEKQEIEYLESVQLWNELLPSLEQSRQHDSVRTKMQAITSGTGVRNAVYMLATLVVSLLAVVLVCAVLLKKKTKENRRHLNF